MEERTALPADIEHTLEGVAELKSDVRRLRAKIDILRDAFTAFVLETTEQFSQLRSDGCRTASGGG